MVEEEALHSASGPKMLLTDQAVSSVEPSYTPSDQELPSCNNQEQIEASSLEKSEGTGPSAHTSGLPYQMVSSNVSPELQAQ